ncbi:MAG TPA: HprK-related kinase A, partial [Chromatiaceae bacterium]|nr:HprK-related kinase A [Chromatiaceae bacterium]
MKFGEASVSWLIRTASREGLQFQAGPFVVHLRSEVPGLVQVFQRLYASFPLLPARGIADFHLKVARPNSIRRFWRPQALFCLDDERPFEPFPLDHAFPLFEWGLNYSIAMQAHQYCLLHSAVIERDGKALVLPAMPGSGKSTLCAALMHRGWRLLSDEFGILDPSTGRLLPLPRVIPLKNRSIGVIRDFAPEAVMGPLFPKTRKGDVVHVAPTPESVDRQDEGALPAWVVFPRFLAGSKTILQTIPGSQAFVRLSNNAFNYR